MSVNEEALGPTSDSFWDVEGYKATVKRQEDGAKLCTDLMNLIQERADIEKSYAKSLTAWNKKWMQTIEKGPEYGTTQAAWKGVLVEAESISSMHSEIREQLLNEVNLKIKEWKQANFKKAVVGPCKETKHLEEEFKKAQKPWAKKYGKVKETRKQYHSTCKMEKSLSNQENNAKADSGMSQDALKKLQDKAEKCRRDVEVTRQKYESALTDLNGYNPKYIEDMTMVFEKSDASEERRLVFFKEMLFGIHKCLDISQNVRLPQIYSQLHHTIDQADYIKDLKWWSQSHGKDMGMNWPQFEEYQEGHHAISRKEKTKSTHISNEGIMLTGVRSENTAPPPSYNTVAANGSTGSERSPPQASPQTQRLPSYDNEMNPFSSPDLDDKNTIDLSTVEDTQISTPVKAQSSQPTIVVATGSPNHSAPAEQKKPVEDYDASLNPFGDEEEVEDQQSPSSSPCNQSPQGGDSESGEGSEIAQRPKPPPKPPRSPGNSVQNQNPFGDDEFDEEEQIDPSNGVPVKAIYDYVGQEGDELSFKEGEVFLKLKDKDDQGWCTGLKDGHVGLYPDNYVQPV